MRASRFVTLTWNCEKEGTPLRGMIQLLRVTWPALKYTVRSYGIFRYWIFLYHYWTLWSGVNFLSTKKEGFIFIASFWHPMFCIVIDSSKRLLVFQKFIISKIDFELNRNASLWELNSRFIFYFVVILNTISYYETLTQNCPRTCIFSS